MIYQLGEWLKAWSLYYPEAEKPANLPLLLLHIKTFQNQIFYYMMHRNGI